MKTLFLPASLTLCLLLLLCSSWPTYANVPAADDPVTGIKFFTGTWKALLAEAKKQNKPIFVDGYTTWCGPCKQMAKQAFPDKAVGEKFNANFISYQLDAEKGEGPALAKQYAVQAYPTSIYVSADGNLIHRAIGYGGIAELLKEADKAIAAAKDPRPIAVWEAEYAGGKRDAAFLQAYLLKRAGVGRPDSAALETYLTQVPETQWTTDKNIEAISGNLTTSRTKAYAVLYKHMMAIRLSDQAAYRTIMTGIQQANRTDYKQAVERRDASQYDRLVANERALITAMLLTPPTPEELEQFTGADHRIQFYRDLKDWTTYRSLATAKATELINIPADSIRAKDELAYKRFQMNTASVPDSTKNKPDFKQYAESQQHAASQQMATSLNSFAWTYFENMTAPADLNQALGWSAHSLKLTRSPMFLDTYAQLLGKLGRNTEAIKHEEEAIALAKAKGDDTAAYEKTLAGLRK